ncbi:MAG: ion transporter [Patescibacteria group bacterium]
METMIKTRQERVHEFFETPSTAWAWRFRAAIILLILCSGVALGIEFFYHELAARHKGFLHGFELFLTIVFSMEYGLRLWSAPSRRKFIFNFYNVIDFIAILPFFFSGLNIGAIRVVRFARFARATKLFRMLKVLRQFWQTSSINTSRLIQENVVKNIVLVVGIILIDHPLSKFLHQVDSGALGDVMFATSILALAAMFGFFSLSYRDFDPTRVSQRILIHLTTSFLLFPVGVMFLIVQTVLSIQIESSPTIIVFGIWFVYTAVVLWDFANVMKLQEKIKP